MPIATTIIPGGSVRVRATYSDTITSAVVDITDPNGTAIITAGAMVLTGTYYEYIWQSLTTAVTGKYKAIVTATLGAYKSKEKIYITVDN